jgi:hypothetical protein
METELDPNLPNRTRTLAARVDHPNSRSTVTPDGLTLPESGQPGERAREWPGVARFGMAWGWPYPSCDRHRGGRPGDLGTRLRPASGPPAAAAGAPREANSGPVAYLLDLSPRRPIQNMTRRRVVGCVGCFDNNILDFECRE